jgi:hypothetical protein
MLWNFHGGHRAVIGRTPAIPGTIYAPAATVNSNDRRQRTWRRSERTAMLSVQVGYVPGGVV